MKCYHAKLLSYLLKVSLIMLNFVFESFVFCVLEVFLLLFPKVFEYCMNYMSCLMYAPWNWFWPKIGGTKCPSHPKTFSSSYETSFWKKKIFIALFSYGESNNAPWWTKITKISRCYATSFHIWVLGDIGKLVPILKLGYYLSWSMPDLRLGNACSSTFHRVLKMRFSCVSLVESFVSNFLS